MNGTNTNIYTSIFGFDFNQCSATNAKWHTHLNTLIVEMRREKERRIYYFISFFLKYIFRFWKCIWIVHISSHSRFTHTYTHTHRLSQSTKLIKKYYALEINVFFCFIEMCSALTFDYCCCCCCYWCYDCRCCYCVLYALWFIDNK